MAAVARRWTRATCIHASSVGGEGGGAGAGGSFNHMLDRLTDAFAGQRAFVADASPAAPRP
jgi:hypothetical protein